MFSPIDCMQFMRVPWLARAFVPGVAAVAAAAAAVEAEVTANGVLQKYFAKSRKLKLLKSMCS